MLLLDFPGGSDSKASAYNVGDPGLIPGSGRSSGEGNGNPLQYSCLENPMDRGAWWATVHRVSKTESHLTNHSDLAINEETVEAELKKFTEETEIPIVIVVDSMENVFGKRLSFADIFTMLLFVGLAVVAVVMIVRRVKNRPAKSE